MNLTICLSAAFLILSHAAFCMPIRGQVKAGNKGLSHVVITDGINFTQTDTKGNFLLDTDQEARFVYLLTPDGYVADYQSGTPEFYLPLDPEKEDYIFQLTETGKRSHHTLLAIADVQTKTDEQFQRFQAQSIPDLKEMIASYPPATPVTGISLGDIVWDVMPLYDSYKKVISDLDLTMYHVIGNHDFDQQYTALSLATNKEEYGELVFGEHFGPTDYSLNVGKVHIISMKDIDYKGKKKYTEQFTPEQLEWLKKDLSYVKPGTTVLLNLHAPTANSTGRGGANARNAEQLFEILKDYKTHIFVGHTHFYENRIVTPVIYEHNIGAACGAWWAGDVNRCGAPNGYLVVNVTGDDISWQYKATGRPFDYQFRVYKPGEFQSQPKYLVVNVWDYDPAWKLSYYEDGVEKSGVMEAFDDEDQDYITMKEGKATGYHTSHLFRVRPTDKAKSVKIVATNRFGQSFTQTVDLK